MLKMTLIELAGPLLRRIGSVVAGGALALGATADQTQQIELMVAGLTGIAVDLAFSHIARKGRK